MIRLADIHQRLLAQRPPSAAPLGWGCFQLGMLLLASSAFLGGLFLLVALILGSLRRPPPLADRCHQLLLLVAALMVAGCFRASSGWLAWVGLGNWLPFFWAFWGFQPYLSTPAARRRIALALVAGTVPVIVTGLGQLWLGWSGPFQMFGGLVIWHIKAGGNPPCIAWPGLFDYANIAGAWLVLVWPLALAALLQPRLGRARRLVVLGHPGLPGGGRVSDRFPQCLGRPAAGSAPGGWNQQLAMAAAPAGPGPGDDRAGLRGGGFLPAAGTGPPARAGRDLGPPQ